MPPVDVLPPNQVCLRNGTIITLKELTAADEFAVEKILQGEGMSLEGAGRASYLRGLAFASIHQIDDAEVAPLRYPKQFYRYLKDFTSRDATTLLQAFVRFNGGQEDKSEDGEDGEAEDGDDATTF